MSLLNPGQRYAINGNITLAIDSVDGIGTAQFWTANRDGSILKLNFAMFSIHGFQQDIRELSTIYTINSSQLDRSVQYFLVTDDRTVNEDIVITNCDDQRFHVPGRWASGQPLIALHIQHLGAWKMTMTANPFLVTAGVPRMFSQPLA